MNQSINHFSIYCMSANFSKQTKNMLKIKIIILWFFCLLMPVCLRSDDSVLELNSKIVDIERIQFVVDPRIELLAVVKLISDTTDKGRRAPILSPLLASATQYFSDSSGNKVCKLMALHKKKHFVGSRVARFFLHLSPPPELLPLAILPDLKIVGMENQSDITIFLDALRSFASSSNFETFFKHNQVIYNEIKIVVSSEFKDSHIVASLESFFSCRLPEYKVVVTPLLRGKGGYGIPVSVASESISIAVIGPEKFQDGKFHFGKKENLYPLVTHEFTHCLLDHASPDGIRYLASGTEALFLPMAFNMVRSGYPTWESSLEENLARAIGVRITMHNAGKNAANQELQIYEKQGFNLVRDLSILLSKYEENREIYPKFSSFLPEIRKYLDKEATNTANNLLMITLCFCILFTAFLIWKVKRWLSGKNNRE